MKKVLLTLALLVSVFALSAQSFYVVNSDGQVVESGSSFHLYGDGSGMGDIVIELQVVANEPVTLIGEKVEHNVVENTDNYFCWGACLDPGTYVSNPVDLTVGTPQVFSAHYMYTNTIEEVIGLEQSMTYNLYYAETNELAWTIDVVFVYTNYGVEENNTTTLCDAYPVPARDVVYFDYSLNSGANAEIAIYNMMGQEVLRNEINGMHGKASVNVSDLADGIYFYSLIVNGKIEKSNKLVVRK